MADALPSTKLASNDHPILDVLRRRWSPRAMDTRPLPRATLHALLEAARWAPSGGNGQPWRFLVLDGSDAAARADAEVCLEPGNAWAKRAPVLLVSATQEIRENGKPNPWARHDLGMATENLLLQASALGLAAHAMAGFNADEARRRFGIPEGYAAVTMIAIGYPGDLATLDDKNRDRELAPRTRRPLAEIVYTGRWGTGFTP